MRDKQTACLWIAAAMAAWTLAVRADVPKPATNEDIQALIQSAGSAKDYRDAPFVYLLDEADVFVRDSGLATTEACQVIKILTDAGVKTLSRQVLEFDPDTYRVTIRSARIHRSGGGVEEVPLADVVTQPAPQHMLYWGNEQHVLDLPRLDIGDVLELRVSRTGVNIAYLAGEATAASGEAGELEPPMPGHWFETTLFQGSHPIVRKRYSVHMPKDKPVQYEVCNQPLKSSFWFNTDHHVITFTAEDIPAVKSEPRMVALDDGVAKVVMATVPDWFMKSRWFWDVNKDQFEADDAIRAMVAEVTAGAATEEDRRAALLHWVADNIRYSGTSRGPREGFTLHTGIETFHDRMGVCKDIAGMLITMFRVLDIDAYPTLTMAGSRVERIPADQFNHTVVAVREEDGSFTLYDPTWAPWSRQMWSVSEPLQGVVYGTPEGEDLTLSPYFPPEVNLAAFTAKSALDESGALDMSIRAELSGYACTALRRAVWRTPPGERQGMFEQAMTISPTARIERVTYTDPLDYSVDAGMTLRVTAPQYAAGSGPVRAFRVPMLSHPLSSLLAPELTYPVDAKTREYGMRLRATRMFRYDETVSLPAGWTVQQVPGPRKMDSGAASLTFEAKPVDGGLTIHLEMSLKHQIVPAEDYPGFKEVLDAMKSLSEDWVLCTVDAAS
jgi:hypothetical protein